MKESEFPDYKYRELSQSFPEEIRQEVVRNIGNQSKLFWILCRHDFAHAPSNWNPEYKHEKYILEFEKFFREKYSGLANSLEELARDKNEKELTESVSQGGLISDLIFPVMLGFG